MTDEQPDAYNEAARVMVEQAMPPLGDTLDSAIAAVRKIYDGSNGDWTKELYRLLEAKGPMGVIALNVFRACKTSERAKVYRGRNQNGRFRDQSYDRKQFSLYNLCEMLNRLHPQAMDFRWGWAKDQSEPYAPWIIYVELPTGQVSFHSPARGMGPLFTGKWDEAKGTAPDRICRWCAMVLLDETLVPAPPMVEPPIEMFSGQPSLL